MANPARVAPSGCGSLVVGFGKGPATSHFKTGGGCAVSPITGETKLKRQRIVRNRIEIRWRGEHIGG